MALCRGAERRIRPLRARARIDQDSHGPRFERLGHHALECFEFGVLEEQPHSSHASVQDVEHLPPGAKRAVLGVAPAYRRSTPCQELDLSLYLPLIISRGAE